MKMPAVRPEESRSPYRVNAAGPGAHGASSLCVIDPADRDIAEILATARFLHRDSTVADPSSANDASAGAPFPRLAVNEDARAEMNPPIPVWSGRTRLGLIIGLPLALWAGIFALIRFVA